MISTGTDPLGATLMHEHLFIRSPGVFEAWPHLWDPEALVGQAIAELTALKDAGIDTIVDLTTVDLGRDIAMIRAVAAAAPVRIVVATGVWREPPRLFERLSADRIADLFVRDIEGAEVAAGVIKVATEPAVDELNEKLLRAAARAHLRTNKPISTHSDVTTRSGLAQIEVFADEGVDLTRVVIGHSGDSDDLDYLKSLLEHGVTLGMDRFGVEQLLPDHRRIDTVAQLCALGFASQMVLSHDAHVFMDTIPPAVRERRLPDWHFQHISRTILPALRAKGVTDDQVQLMLVSNPRRILAG